MKTIREYALDMVADGAESTIEDDMNESGAIAEEDHEAACELAMAIVHAIRQNPDKVLALVHAGPEAAAPTPPQQPDGATPTT